jgi:formamidopyrimidine-DNA glycosylase
MPELPEVETVRRGLERSLVGRRFDEVAVGRDRVARRTSRQELRDGLTGARVVEANRRGKYLLLELDTDAVVMVHLRMSGQVIIDDGASEAPRHSHVTALLDDGSRFLFVDPRTFGEVVVAPRSRIDVLIPEIGRLGRDPLVDGVDMKAVTEMCRNRRRRVKSLLLDQSHIAGIGNIYADEICHSAGIRPDRPAETLSSRSRRRLTDAIVGVIEQAVELGGSTLADSQYVGVDGQPGTFQERHRVYARTGQRCVSCGRGIIRRILIDQRGSHFCPVCQR